MLIVLVLLEVRLTLWLRTPSSAQLHNFFLDDYKKTGLAGFFAGALRGAALPLPADFLAGAARLAGDLVTVVSSIRFYTRSPGA